MKDICPLLSMGNKSAVCLHFFSTSIIGDVIPQDYTLIDVAYYYKWEKDSPMQFFYRIFKKNKVLLKRRKRKSRNEDKISDGKKPRSVECTNNNSSKDSKSAPNAGSKPGNLMKEDANHNR